MNVRKLIDYTAMFASLDELMVVDLPQIKLYYKIGRLVSSRPEKGAAAAAAKYLQTANPDATGFSPRNLRRMREFYRMHSDTSSDGTELDTERGHSGGKADATGESVVSADRKSVV